MQDLHELQDEAFDVEDDIMLLIHPFAILEITKDMDYLLLPVGKISLVIIHCKVILIETRK